MKKLAELMIICREVDKNSGEKAIYPLNVRVTGDMLAKLSIRARMNPELRYFATLAETWDDRKRREQIGRLLSIPDVTPKMLQDCGGFVVEV